MHSGRILFQWMTIVRVLSLVPFRVGETPFIIKDSTMVTDQNVRNMVQKVGVDVFERCEGR